MLWYYHSGRQALCLRLPEMQGKAQAWHTAEIRSLGWKCDDIQCIRSLPRVDEGPSLGVKPPYRGPLVRGR